jgi:uncharacterized protein (DUF433 family)
MAFIAQTDASPLREEPDGAVRVGSSRVLLELVIRAFVNGATPEAIVQQYTSLSLSDAYGAIAYYLRHRADVDEYLARRAQQVEDVRELIDQQQGDLREIRARLLARRSRIAAARAGLHAANPAK